MSDDDPPAAPEQAPGEPAGADDVAEATTSTVEHQGRLPRNVYVVSAVSFFQDAASEMLYPVLPFFITGLLGAPPAVLGLIEGLADGTAAVTKAAAGRLADLRRRRPIIATGYGISSIGKLLLALAVAWPMVLLARVTDRMGKGIRGAPRDALIADEVTSPDRGRAFGFHRAADTAGAVVGPLLGLAAYEALGQQLRPLFFLALIPATVSTLLVFAIREREHPRPKHTGLRFTTEGLPTRYWRLLSLLGLFAVVNFPDALLLLRANELGLGVAGVVGVYVAYNLTYAAFSYPAGVLSDRLSRRRIFSVGLAVFAFTYLGFGLTDAAGWVWVLLPVYGCYTALTDGVGRAWVADVVPSAHRGTALGLQSAVSGLGLLVAGVWAGLAWGGTGHVPFVISGILAAVVAAVIGLAGGHLGLDPEPAAEPIPG